MALRDAKRRRAILWALIGCGISALLCWLAVREIEFHEVGAALRGADLVTVLGAGMLLLLTFPVLAVRWAGLARKLNPPPLPRMLELSLVGIAINNTLPGRLGELARAVGLARATGRPLAATFGSVVVDRVGDVVVLTVVFGATFALVPDVTWVRWLGVGAAIVAVAAIALVIAAVVLLRARQAASARSSWLRRRLRSFAEGLDCVPTVSAAIRAGTLTVLAWALWVGAAMLVARSLDISISVIETAFLAAVLNLGTAIPSSPGFVGTYQWLAVAAMGLLGVAADGAFAFSVLLQALWLIPTTIVGVAVMLKMGLSIGSLRPVALDGAPGG